MKTKIMLTFLMLFLAFLSGNTQTIWTGPKITFERVNVLGLDISLVENQDRITDNVWITSASSQGIFNIKTENSYAYNSSPSKTEWAFEITDNIAIAFNDWESTVVSPPTLVGQNMVLHLIAEDIYLDIKFNSWASGKDAGFGGFSYVRSTDQNLGVDEFSNQKTLTIYPNPSSEFIHLNGIINTQNVKIFNALGVKVLEKTIDSNNKIEIKI